MCKASANRRPAGSFSRGLGEAGRGRNLRTTGSLIHSEVFGDKGTAMKSQLKEKQTLTLAVAKTVAAAAEAEAVAHGWTVVIALVDDGGHLIYLQRMDATQVGSIDIAVAKAASAVNFKRPTKAF